MEFSRGITQDHYRYLTNNQIDSTAIMTTVDVAIEVILNLHPIVTKEGHQITFKSKGDGSIVATVKYNSKILEEELPVKLKSGHKATKEHILNLKAKDKFLIKFIQTTQEKCIRINLESSIDKVNARILDDGSGHFLVSQTTIKESYTCLNDPISLQIDSNLHQLELDSAANQVNTEARAIWSFFKENTIDIIVKSSSACNMYEVVLKRLNNELHKLMGADWNNVKSGLALLSKRMAEVANSQLPDQFLTLMKSFDAKIQLLNTRLIHSNKSLEALKSSIIEETALTQSQMESLLSLHKSLEEEEQTCTEQIQELENHPVVKEYIQSLKTQLTTKVMTALKSFQNENQHVSSQDIQKASEILAQMMNGKIPIGKISEENNEHIDEIKKMILHIIQSDLPVEGKESLSIEDFLKEKIWEKASHDLESHNKQKSLLLEKRSKIWSRQTSTKNQMYEIESKMSQLSVQSHRVNNALLALSKIGDLKPALQLVSHLQSRLDALATFWDSQLNRVRHYQLAIENDKQAEIEASLRDFVVEMTSNIVPLKTKFKNSHMIFNQQ